MKTVLMMFAPSMFPEKILLLTAFFLVAACRVQAAIVIHFDELSPPPNGYFDGSGATATSGNGRRLGGVLLPEPNGPGRRNTR